MDDAPRLTPPPLPGMSPDPPAPAPSGGWRSPLLGLLAGMLLLGLVGLVEGATLANKPWTDAVLLDASTEAEGHAAWVRPLPLESREEDAALIDDLSILFPATEQDFMLETFYGPEALVAMEIGLGEIEPYLVSGRLPTPGAAEVLAGDLARAEAFELDGVAFEVVGRLAPEAGPFLYSYLLIPDAAQLAAHFEGHDDTRRAVLVEDRGVLQDTLSALAEKRDAVDPVDGMDEMDGVDEADADAEAEAGLASPVIAGGMVRSAFVYQFLTIVGLLIMAVAGALLHLRIFRRLATFPDMLLQPVFIEMVKRPRLLIGMHLGLYGIFFGAMIAGMAAPLFNYRMTMLITHEFTQGSLQYLGDAYASGNVLNAAVATFINNYIYQTLGLTFLISLVPLALGVLKTAMSFLLVGFVMAPLWAGTAVGYSYHSVTMVLELEAYIVACFCVVAWPIRLSQAIRNTDEKPLLVGLRVMFGGALLTGIMLFTAALYEAATLILLR